MCVFHIRKELLKCGYYVTVFTHTVDHEPGEENIVRCPWSFSFRGLWNTSITLWKLIQNHDIVHSMYSFRIAALCAVFVRLQGKKMLLTQQGKGIVPEANPHWHHAILVKLCQHLSMKLCHHITSTSDEITELTEKFVSKEKITLVSNGYNADLFRPDANVAIPPEYVLVPSGTKKILSVRRLVPKNGIHILIQALALVRNVRTDFHYFAIGDGRSREFIESLICELRLEKNITLLGKKGNDVLLPYYRHADCIIIPSSAEARSIACIEAMAMGKPLIASKVGGLIDLIGRTNDYGTLVSIYGSESCTYDPPLRLPEDSLRPLADVILDVLDHPQSFEMKAQQAAMFAQKNYSWETITKAYLRLYEFISTDCIIRAK